MKGQAIPLPFPAGGISEGGAYADAAGPVAIRADHVLNVRPFEAIEKRLRGGTRPGLSKFIADRANSSLVQELLTVIEASSVTGSVSGALGSKYSNPGTLPSGAGLGIDFHPDGNYVAWCSSTSNQVSIYEFDPVTGFGARTANFTLDTVTNQVKFSPDGDYLAVGTRSGAASSSSARIRVYPFSTVDGTVGAQINPGAHPAGQIVSGIAWSPTGGAIACSAGGSGAIALTVYAWTGSAFGSKYSDPGDMPTDTGGGVAFHPSGTAIALSQVTADNLIAWDWTDASGFGTSRNSPTLGHTLATGNGNVAWHPSGAYVLYCGIASAGSNDVLAIAWTSGSGWGSVVGGFELTPTNNKPTSPRLDVSDSGNFVAVGATAAIFTDNQEIFVRQFTAGTFGSDLSSGLIASVAFGTSNVSWHPDDEAFATASGSSPRINAWEFDVTSTPSGPSAREISLVSVQGGNVYRSDSPPTAMTLVTNGDGDLEADIPVAGAQVFQDVFFCDSTSMGYRYLDLADNTLKDWSAAVTDGSLPTSGTQGCRMMALFRGRIVLSGLQDDPHNWFMSRTADPFDWDYSPATTDETMAVAGNNAEAGLIGDIITALASFQDDLLLFGCDHSLWMLQGDPAAGGQIDKVSGQVGIVGPRAWCFDPENNLYFLGKNGLYILQFGRPPELLSSNRLDAVLAAIDLSTNHVRLVYDPQHHGVHIFIVPTSQPGAVADHYYWDKRTDSFWRDQFPVTTGPTALLVYDGDDPDDRAVLLGGFDGYIRRVDADATSDDGTAIDSYVRLPIIHPSLPMGQYQLDEVQIHLDGDGSGASLDIYRGKTPEEVAESSSSAYTKTLLAGRNVPTRKALRANAVQFRIRATALNARWAYENGVAFMSAVGRQRKGVS